MVENISCFPSCESFRCGQRALTRVGRRVHCRWAEDDCVGPTCNYAMCIRERLLSNGVCGLSVKRKTDEEAAPEAIRMNDVKLRGKLLRRFREDDLI